VDLKVKRIVSNIESSELDKAVDFYGGIFGLDVLMDLGWIRTYGSDSKMSVQISIVKARGSGASVPDLTIEVDDIEVALDRVKKANIRIEYGPQREEWGVRRFFVRDPFGKLINVMQLT
jgi:catechol 2,3-dioxygenase-like lactoylglutathione lyase family enzyme